MSQAKPITMTDQKPLTKSAEIALAEMAALWRTRLEEERAITAWAYRAVCKATEAEYERLFSLEKKQRQELAETRRIAVELAEALRKRSCHCGGDSGAFSHRCSRCVVLAKADGILSADTVQDGESGGKS